MPASRAPTGPHADVGARFAHFLDSVGLDRDGFVAAVDGAVTARSLYAVLAGTRRPSRALAVLIERTWGYRADHLLEGDEPAWTAAPAMAAGATARPEAARAAAFADRSSANARALDSALDRAELWEQVYAGVTDLLAELDAHRIATEEAADGASAPTYAVHARQVLDQCRFLGERFGDLVAADHDAVVQDLVVRFLRHFLADGDEQGARLLALAEQRRELAHEHAARLDEELRALA